MGLDRGEIVQAADLAMHRRPSGASQKSSHLRRTDQSACQHWDHSELLQRLEQPFAVRLFVAPTGLRYCWSSGSVVAFVVAAVAAAVVVVVVVAAAAQAAAAAGVAVAGGSGRVARRAVGWTNRRQLAQVALRLVSREDVIEG